MRRTRRLWVPVLAGLLVAGVLGVGGGGAVAVEPRTVTASIMVPAAAFNPTNDKVTYSNYGDGIRTIAGGGTFIASLSFPVPVVTIKRITVYAYDNDGAANVCVGLYRARPADGIGSLAGFVCSVDSAANPQTIYTTAISPRQVNTAFHGAYLSISLGAPGNRFYGARITYSYNSGA